MGKIRVYKLAKELDVQSTDLVDRLQELGEDVTSHMSTVGEETANAVRELLGDTPEENQVEEEPVLTAGVDHTEETAEEIAPIEEEKIEEQETEIEEDEDIIELQLPVNAKDLGEALDVDTNTVMGKLIGLGVMATINQHLEPEAIELVAEDLGETVKFVTEEDKLEKKKEIVDDPEDLELRPPIVTVMGHVDHGKTSLLDAIRKTEVTATEAGGITQHIGAYQTRVDGKKITFLDTPDHEAFTAMRARGAQLTDIAILVVAADDGIMPQTVEAINHAKAADVPMIVAVNKIDKNNANPDRVLQELTEHGLVPEVWGGDTICVNVSALKQMNIDELLEMILLVAEMEQLKANPSRPADGVIVEAKLDRGRGPVATVLVKRGTLKVGDPIVAGSAYGRVRAMIDDKGERVEEAEPSKPVVILGLSDVAEAGDGFEVVEDDRTARTIAEERAERKRQQELQANKNVSLDDFFKQMQEGEVKDLKLVIKADVRGSAEALKEALLKLNDSSDEVRVLPIHTGVGGITPTDVMLASASEAIIIGFNVRPDLNAKQTAEKENIDIRTYRVIYKALEEVRAALEGMLDPDIKEVVVGHAQVRATFKVPKVGTVAGLYVKDGHISRNDKVRLLRDGRVIHEGEIDSLKRFQDDVREVKEGYECGLGIEGYNDVKEGDEIEAIETREIRRSLD